MESANFFDYWDYSMRLGAAISVGLAIVIFLLYEVRVSSIKDLKKKYDFVSSNEIRFFWYSVVAVIVAMAFFINSIATDTISASSMLWFYVRLFITASFIVIAYFIFFGMVKIYYPKSVEKRLKKLREKPRLSPDGNVMRKLSEEEEDAHLEASQIAEEEVHSIDYDVWIDEKTGYKQIEKYFSYQHAEECPECGYYTLKINHEELTTPPTESTTGLLIKHFQCHYCKHREQRETVIARLSDNV